MQWFVSLKGPTSLRISAELIFWLLPTFLATFQVWLEGDRKRKNYGALSKIIIGI